MLNKLHILLLVVLYESSDGLLPFSLFKRSRSTLSDFVKALENLKALDLISESDNLLRISRRGQEIIVKIKPLQQEGVKPWRLVPEELLGFQMKPNDFYIPSKKKLDKDILN